MVAAATTLLSRKSPRCPTCPARGDRPEGPRPAREYGRRGSIRPESQYPDLEILPERPGRLGPAPGRSRAILSRGVESCADRLPPGTRRGLLGNGRQRAPRPADERIVYQRRKLPLASMRDLANFM